MNQLRGYNLYDILGGHFNYVGLSFLTRTIIIFYSPGRTSIFWLSPFLFQGFFNLK